MVLRGDLEADGHVVLRLDVDVEAVLHRAQAHGGRLAVHERDLGVEARAHDTVELAQALDDHGVLLLDHVEQVAGDNAHDQKDNHHNENDANDVC